MPVKAASNGRRKGSIDVELNRSDFSLTEKIFSTNEPLRIGLLIHARSVDYKSTIDTVSKYVDLSILELAPLIAASVRTIERSAQARKKLGLIGADRMYRFARVFDLATRMLGDAQRAKRWIRMRSQYLGNKTPLEMLQTDIGARAVERSLYAIGYGKRCLRVARIARIRYAKSGTEAYNGEGSRLSGARWHSAGTRIVYTSESEALALLEYLTHVSIAIAPRDLGFFAATVPDNAIAEIATLPRGDAHPPRLAGASVGDESSREAPS